MCKMHICCVYKVLSLSFSDDKTDKSKRNALERCCPIKIMFALSITRSVPFIKSMNKSRNVEDNVLPLLLFDQIRYRETDEINTRNCELQSLSIHIYLYNNLFFNDKIVTFRNYNGYINMSHLFETINFSRYKQFSVKDIFALISLTIYIVLLRDLARY